MKEYHKTVARASRVGASLSEVALANPLEKSIADDATSRMEAADAGELVESVAPLGEEIVEGDRILGIGNDGLSFEHRGEAAGNPVDMQPVDAEFRIPVIGALRDEREQIFAGNAPD